MKFPAAVIITLFFCFAVAALAWFVTGIGLPYGVDGTKDFIQYWAAWKLLCSGQNPYDASLMHQMQLVLGQAPDVTIMMWNPPWVPLLMSPVLALPFEASALCWFFCNMGLIGLVVAAIPSVLGHGVQRPWVYGVGALFLPLIESLKWGQMSLWHTLGAILFIYQATRSRFFWSGVAATLMTAKPHIYLLFIAPGIFWIYQIGYLNAMRFVAGSAVAMTLLIAATLVIQPQAIEWWIVALSNSEPGFGAVPVRLWRTATMATTIRAELSAHLGYIPDWPLSVFPAIGFIGTLGFLVWHKSKIVWVNLAPALVCLSFIFASYGWLYDQSALILAHFSIFLSAITSRRVSSRVLDLGGLFAIQLLILLLGMQPDSAQHHYTWVPVALLLLVWRQNVERRVPLDR